MKILIFSVGPVFPQAVHGGSQKILRQIAIYLGSKGNLVRILCVRRPDNCQPFQLSSNVQVLPVLKLKPCYPEPYYTAPYNLSDLIVLVHRNIDWCDVFYAHDSELPFHFLYQDCPTVSSFRDFVYPDTLVGGFGFQRDKLILNSEYVARCVIDAFAPFRPNIAERIVVIKNGIDLSHFIRRNGKPSPQLMKVLGHPPSSTFTLLYPHRPDKHKGIFDALQITAELNRRFSKQGSSVKLLIPRWMDSSLNIPSEHEYQVIYSQIIITAEKLGIRKFVHLHPWISQALMPEYLSLGDITLSVGDFVEAFGNIQLESIACGTPCVAAKVAAHASALPDEFVKKIPHGDVLAAADCIEDILAKGYDVVATRDFLSNNYSMENMLNNYEKVFSTVKVLEPLKFVTLPKLDKSSQLRLAAWCRYDGLGIYNDYAYSRIIEPRRIELALAAKNNISLEKLLLDGFSLEEVETNISDGILVRVLSDMLGE